MNFDDLKDRLLELWNRIKSDIEENPTFNTLREKYETLPGRAQKGIIVGTILLVTWFLISIPMGFFDEALTYEEEYIQQKNLLRKLLKTGKPQEGASAFSNPPSTESLKMRISEKINTYNLTSEQQGSVTEGTALSNSMARPPVSEETVRVSLKALNLSQIVQLGYELQGMFPSVKVTGLDLKENEKHANYFDTTYTLSKFALPESSTNKAEETKNKPTPRSRRNRRTGE